MKNKVAPFQPKTPFGSSQTNADTVSPLKKKVNWLRGLLLSIRYKNSTAMESDYTFLRRGQEQKITKGVPLLLDYMARRTP